MPPEIIVIKRVKGGEEGHHGGVWKIAYADFMTAMMALFLVMWLVNASDERTVAQIVTYFNPIDFTDRRLQERGVQDSERGGTGKDSERQPKKSEKFDKHAEPQNETGKLGMSDEGLFSDPYEVLAKLAATASKVSLPSSDGIRQDSDARMAGGEAFRDPFDPDFRFNSDVKDGESQDIRPNRNSAEGKDGTGRKDESAPAEAAAGSEKAEGKPGAMPFSDTLAQAGEEAPKDKQVKPDAPNDKAAQAEAAEMAKAIAAEAGEIKTDLREALREANLAKLPQIAVEETAEGVLISITDQSNFEMFAVSSAEPRPELVVLMEKVAKVLSDQKGDIVIRGHTDRRPFRSKTYDNWRLSTARAHIAHYMLLRGGLPKQRIERIEGHADRDLKVSKDPNAPQNRRIEILLRPAKA
jgi:chemotaxis protein MotB